MLHAPPQTHTLTQILEIYNFKGSWCCIRCYVIDVECNFVELCKHNNLGDKQINCNSNHMCI